MNRKQRIIETQELTRDYFKTAKLLEMTYEEVRQVCEAEEEDGN